MPWSVCFILSYEGMVSGPDSYVNQRLDPLEPIACHRPPFATANGALFELSIPEHTMGPLVPGLTLTTISGLACAQISYWCRTDHEYCQILSQAPEYPEVSV